MCVARYVFNTLQKLKMGQSNNPCYQFTFICYCRFYPMFYVNCKMFK